MFAIFYFQRSLSFQRACSSCWGLARQKRRCWGTWRGPGRWKLLHTFNCYSAPLLLIWASVSCFLSTPPVFLHVYFLVFSGNFFFFLRVFFLSFLLCFVSFFFCFFLYSSCAWLACWCSLDNSYLYLGRNLSSVEFVCIFPPLCHCVHGCDFHVCVCVCVCMCVCVRVCVGERER